MKIAITGAGGLIGKALTAKFRNRGDDIIVISREMILLPSPRLAELLEGVSLIVNLAGAPIVSRWNRKYKEVIYQSRINTTRKLAEAIALLKTKPGLLISSSAVGIYASEGVHTEIRYKWSGDFLGNLCIDWEAAARRAECRVVTLRTGIVLSKEGGMLKKVLLPFRLGLGGRIASGTQGVSWIHIRDVVNIIMFLVDHPEVEGPVNMTAPNPVDNKQFTKALARALDRPAWLPIPGFLLKLLFGEGAEVLTSGQLVQPERLLSAGFRFEFESLDEALRDLVRNRA